MTHPSPPSVRRILAERRFVERLAHSLIEDQDDAEDVIQETWARVLLSPPRHGGNLRGWLRAVVLNAVRRSYWHSLRSRESHREADDVDPVTPEAEVSRAQMARLVVKELLALPDRYRSVLLGIYFEGRTPNQLAGDLGRAVFTIHSQHRRGISLLRNRLSRHAPRDGESWPVIAFWPVLASVARGPSLERARPRLGGLAAGAAVGAVAVSSILFFLSMGQREPMEPSVAPAVTRASAVHAPGVPVSSAHDSASGAMLSRRAIAAPHERSDLRHEGASPTPLHEVHVEVVDESGHSIEGAEVRVGRRRETDPRFCLVDFETFGETDERGDLTLVVTEAHRTSSRHRPSGDWIHVMASAPGRSTNDIHSVPFPEAEAGRVRIPLLPGATLAGALVTEDGSPVRGTVQIGTPRNHVILDEPEHVVVRAAPVVHTAADGTFLVEGLAPERHAVSIEATGYLPDASWVDVRLDDEVKRVVTMARGGGLSGRVRGPDGLPQSGVRVRVEYGRARLHRLPFEVESDADGRFELGGLPPGRALVSLEARRARTIAAHQVITVPAGQDAHLDVRLSSAVPWRALVLDANGGGLSHHLVELASPDELWVSTVRTDSSGRIELDVVPRGPFQATVFASETEYFVKGFPLATFDGLRGGARIAELVLPQSAFVPRGALLGRLARPGGGREARILLESEAGDWRTLPVAASSGAFAIDAPQGRYVVSVWSEGCGISELARVFVPSGGRTDLGTLRLPRRLALHLDAIDLALPAAPRVEGTGYRLLALDAPPEVSVLDEGAWPPPSSYELFPGSYVLESYPRQAPAESVRLLEATLTVDERVTSTHINADPEVVQAR